MGRRDVMNKQMSKRTCSFSKLLAMALVIALFGFYIFPMQSVHAAGEEDPDDEAISSETSADEEPDGEIGPIRIIPPDLGIDDEPVPEASHMHSHEQDTQEHEEAAIPAERPPLTFFTYWALMNLILTVVTGIAMAALFVNYQRKRKEAISKGEAGKASKHLVLFIISAVTTAIAIILFALTQDIRLPMLFSDEKTIWHVIIAAAAMAMAVFGMSIVEEEEDITDIV